MGLFANLFKTQQRVGSGDNPAEKIAECHKQTRDKFYSSWVSELRKSFPQMTIRSPVPSEDADFSINIYQLIWTCWFISEKDYIVEADRGKVFTLLYTPLTRVHGDTKVSETISRYLNPGRDVSRK